MDKAKKDLLLEAVSVTGVQARINIYFSVSSHKFYLEGGKKLFESKDDAKSRAIQILAMEREQYLSETQVVSFTWEFGNQGKPSLETRRSSSALAEDGTWLQHVGPADGYWMPPVEGTKTVWSIDHTMTRHWKDYCEEHGLSLVERVFPFYALSEIGGTIYQEYDEDRWGLLQQLLGEFGTSTDAYIENIREIMEG